MLQTMFRILASLVPFWNVLNMTNPEKDCLQRKIGSDLHYIETRVLFTVCMCCVDTGSDVVRCCQINITDRHKFLSRVLYQVKRKEKYPSTCISVINKKMAMGKDVPDTVMKSKLIFYFCVFSHRCGLLSFSLC